MLCASSLSLMMKIHSPLWRNTLVFISQNSSEISFKLLMKKMINIHCVYIILPATMVARIKRLKNYRNVLSSKNYLGKESHLALV
jgi:hypothetical protein